MSAKWRCRHARHGRSFHYADKLSVVVTASAAYIYWLVAAGDFGIGFIMEVTSPLRLGDLLARTYQDFSAFMRYFPIIAASYAVVIMALRATSSVPAPQAVRHHI